MLNESVSMFNGFLTVEKVYEDGQREVVSSRTNQIVNGCLTTLAELITQVVSGDPSVFDLAVHSMWIESSPAALAHGVRPTDTGPEGTISKYYVFDRNSDVDVNLGGVLGLVEFRATLAQGEANGQIIRAAGLYTRGDDDRPELSSNPRLVARQIFGAIDKQSDFALDFTWRIQFLIG